MNKLASALTGTEGERVALCDVSVSALLQDLLAEVTVSQTYRNDERVNIEAVYTFRFRWMPSCSIWRSKSAGGDSRGWSSRRRPQRRSTRTRSPREMRP